MTTQEIAIKKGVALPETCKGLVKDKNFNQDKYPKTYWVWLKLKNDDEWFLASLEADEQYYAGYSKTKIDFCLPAPQMQEIVVRLPEKLVNYEGYESVDFCESNKKIGYGVINRFFATEIENNHYAEAYAQMYLQLKEVNLI